MSVAALAVLGPLAACVLLLAARRQSEALALLGAAVGCAGAAATLIRVAEGARFAATLLGLPEYPLRLLVDPLAAILGLTVATVTLLVLVYAVGYMEREGDHVRFFAEVSFFAAAMQTLVLAGDWLLLLAAWELIGLASYLLIGFWFERPAVPPAAARAFLTTRTADLGLYLAVFLLVSRTGTTTIAPTLHVSGGIATLAGLLLLLAAMGKAAQVPFQGWLQDAMLGPTPVSALLHSATLVAAGALLLARSFSLLSPDVRLVVGVVGGVTALVTGLMAIAQPDLKRLLAASTSSQLGFMFLAFGAGSLVAAVVHLVVHAAMKSALFLGAGVVQQARGSTMLAELAGSGRAYPLVYLGVVIAGLSLAAIPPLAGFWSKDTILAATFIGSGAPLFGTLGLVGSLFTGAYIGRALRALWHGDRSRATVPGLGWMDAGLGGVALLAASLGLAVQPIGRLLGVAVPENVPATALGLVAALTGLAAGWQYNLTALFGTRRAWVAAGFRLDGGFVGLVARPALALAGRVDQTDRALHRGVLGVGQLALAVARAVRGLDDRGIDSLIGRFVRTVTGLGGAARRLQSGLVSRELAYTAVGIAALILLVLAVR